MLKKFLIGTLAVVAFVFTANLALASYDFGSAILKVGSRGQYVTTLQNLVGATPIDGLFGPMTKAKVVAWQMAHDLMADGLFGNLSKAKANETGTNFPAGCMNASGFSTTTGFPCSSLNANTFPTGCTNASGFSTTTGLNCLNNLPPIRGGGSSGGHHATVLVPTGDMIFALTTPAENGGTNHLTVNEETNYVNAGVANGTTSVVITGTKLSTQTVTVTGMGEPLPRDDSYNVVVTGTGTNPIYTVNTVTNGLSSPDGPGDNVSLTGGNKTFKLTVSETNKTDIVYTINVQVANPTAPADIAAAGVTGFVAPITGATPQSFGTLTAVGATYTVTGLTWSPVHNPYQGLTAYTATVTLTSDANYKFPVGNIASPTANTGTVNSIGTTAGGNVTGNTLSYTVLFPATGYTNVTSANYTTANNTTITITLAEGSFKAAPIYATDFIFGGTDANAIANATAIATYGAFGRTDANHVAITGLSAHLLGSINNTVTVKGATQASQVITVTAVAS